MVTVPGAQDLSSTQRALVNQPNPVSLASADAFGAQIAHANQEIGRATARAGTALSDRVLQETIDDNIREMKEGLNDYGRLKRGCCSHLPTPRVAPFFRSPPG